MRQYLFLLSALLLITGCAPQPISCPPQAKKEKCYNAQQLNQYSYEHLSKVAMLMRQDAKKIDEFSGYISAIKGSVNDYAQIIRSSVYLTNVVRYLPIPYAGEASSITKVVSNTLLNLNGAAVSLDRYQKSSTVFLESFDRLDRNTATSTQLAKLASYADTVVINDAEALQDSLQGISSSASTLAATTQSISNAISTGGDYLNQAKSFVGMKASANEEEKLKASGTSFHAKLALLSQKICALENSAQTHRGNVLKARTYAELAQQL